MSHEVTVGQLVEYLRDVPEDMPVRLAFQPSWPLQFFLSDDIRVVRGVCYLAEGSSVYDTPYAPRAVFGEPEQPECAGCSRTCIIGSVDTGARERELTCRNCLEEMTPEQAATFTSLTEANRSYSVGR